MDKSTLEGLLSILDNWAAFFTLLVVIGVGGELVVHVMQSRANKKLIALQNTEALAQEAEIVRMKNASASFELDIAKANKGSAAALERAAKAEENLGNAKKDAADANAKAEGFRLSIAKANESASQAQSQVANATAEAAKANLELARLRTSRSLTHIPELIAALSPFKDTEYVFVSVFQDEESMYLLRAIDEVLQKAEWKRGKSVAGFPGINIYGNEARNFAVPIGFNTGIQISVDFPEPLSAIESLPMDKLPPPINAAAFLDMQLSASLSPSSDLKKVNVEKGTSTTIRIAVGKKP
jgi:hypothetical protein